MRAAKNSMKPLLLYLNFLVVTLAEMLVSHTLQKPITTPKMYIDSSDLATGLEDEHSSIHWPWRMWTKGESHTLPFRAPDHRPTKDRQEGESSAMARIIKRNVSPALSRRSPMQGIGTVRERVAVLDQGQRDADAKMRAQEQKIAEARERARAMSPPRVIPPPSQAGPSIPEQQVSTSQPSRSTSPVRRPPSPPRQPSPRARQSTSPPPQPPQPSQQTSSPSRERSLSPQQQSTQSRQQSPTPQTPSLRQPPRRLTIPRLPIPTSREPSPEARTPSARRLASAMASSPTMRTGPSRSLLSEQQPVLSEKLPSLPQLASPRPSSPLRQRPTPQSSSARQSSPTRQQSPIRLIPSGLSTSTQSSTLTRQASLPQSSTPRLSSLRGSSSRILLAQTTNMEGGDPSPFQATPSRSQPNTPPRLSRQASTNSADSFRTAGGSSTKDASDPAALEEALRRSNSLPASNTAEGNWHLRSVQSASQPGSPRQRSPLNLSQTQRSVSLSDNLQIINLSSSTPSTPRGPTSQSPRPLRSALRGSTGNLVGMVRPLEPLRENSIETPGAGVLTSTLMPLTALPREGPLLNAASGNTSPTTSRTPSLQRALSLQRAESLPSTNGILPQTGGTGVQSVQTPRASNNQPTTPNHIGTAPAARPSPSTPSNVNHQSTRRGMVASASSSTIASQGGGPARTENEDRSGRGGRLSRMTTQMTTQLSARVGEAGIEDERHPGKFGTTIKGTLLSGGIVGGIVTGINHHSIASIVGGTLAGSCVGLTGIVGTCYFMQNARTTVERENISFEERLRRGHELLSNYTLANMVPKRARNAYRSWRGLPPLPTNPSTSPGTSSDGSPEGAVNAAQDAGLDQVQHQHQNQNHGPSMPSEQGSMPSPFAPHPDPAHPEHLVRRGLSIHPPIMKSWRLEF